MKDRLKRTLRTFALITLAWFLMPMMALAQVAHSLPEDNINFQYWQVITGFLLPLVLSFILQSKWSSATQAAVAFVASIVVTIGQMWIYGQLDNFTDPAQSVLIVLALTITFYKGWWKPTGVSPKIEQATNLST